MTAALTIWKWGRLNESALRPGRPLGSYETWSRWVRDPLLALGCADPVERTALLKARDPIRERNAQLFTEWWARHADRPMQLIKLDIRVTHIIDPQGRGRQYVAVAIGRLVGTRAAGFVSRGRTRPGNGARRHMPSNASKRSYENRCPLWFLCLSGHGLMAISNASNSPGRQNYRVHRGHRTYAHTIAPSVLASHRRPVFTTGSDPWRRAPHRAAVVNLFAEHMRLRLSISLVFAAALTLAGVALAYQACARTAPFEFVVSGFAIAAGLTWLWSVIREWRAKE